MIKNENSMNQFSEQDVSRIIEMAWEDRTPFEAILCEYGLNEAAVISLMRQNMKASSFKMWRERVTGRKTKHLQLRSPDLIRADTAPTDNYSHALHVARPIQATL